jgi:two-component system chemotaxis response regulator CheB
MIRVLVAEDSAVVREYLLYLLDKAVGLRVVGAARDGLEAVEQTKRLKPDVILMDVHMPRLNGYDATRRIMEEAPTPIVMISASFNRDEVGMTFEALKAGALTVLEKPCGPDHPQQTEQARQLVETLRLMAEVKVIRRWPRRSVPPTALGAPSDRRIRIIAFGASTGGPAVTAEILEKLPRGFEIPLLLVQHIAPGFVGGLAEWLNGQTPLTVKLAEPGEPVRPGTVYLAPDQRQMGVSRDERIRLTNGEAAEDGFSPSASYLFRSVAEAYQRSAAGILLTGMGRDGAAGLLRLREVGGLTVAQDKESSVIFGMPAEAVRLGAAEYILSPDEIAVLINSLASQR